MVVSEGRDVAAKRDTHCSRGRMSKVDSAEKRPLAGDCNGGESLAAPRGVSDASRRCKQRPSKFLVEGRFFLSATSRLSESPMSKVKVKMRP
jgi:hypothetical protein